MKVALQDTKDFKLTITSIRDGETKTCSFHAFACRNREEAIKRAKDSGEGVRVLRIEEQ